MVDAHLVLQARLTLDVQEVAIDPLLSSVPEQSMPAVQRKRALARTLSSGSN